MQVSKCTHIFARTLCPSGMRWGLCSISQSCASASFTSMQLNQDNCADGAVDAAFISKENGKIACQIYSSLLQGRMSAAVLLEVHLCKGLWPEELWWIQELSGDKHVVLRLQLVWEVTENFTSKNRHLSCWLSEQWAITSKTSLSSGPGKWEHQCYNYTRIAQSCSQGSRWQSCQWSWWKQKLAQNAASHCMILLWQYSEEINT